MSTNSAKTLFDSETVEIDVPSATLKKVGAKSVICSSHVAESDFAKILDELKELKVGHTWKKYPKLDIGNFYNIKNEENKKRQTQFFFYYALIENKLDFLGAATVAQSISKNFEYQGFPVISRCFVLSKYRNCRFYSPILRHRIQYCEDHFGENLKAIHMGTSNLRVLKAAINNSFFNFKFIGCESLDCGEYQETVFDFLRFSPNYLKKVMTDFSQKDPFILDIINKIIDLKFQPSEVEELFNKLLEMSDESHYAKELLGLFRAIGVVQMDSNEIVERIAEQEFSVRID